VSYRIVCVLALAVGLECVAVAADRPAPDPAKPQYTSDLKIWPNAVSKANSDPWIVKNHDKIRKMQPRVLVLNFSNGFGQDKAEQTAKQLCSAVTEGTRYHGYKDKKAKPFVEWQIFKIVDLRDPEPCPETPDGNSTKYPRVPNWKEGINFAYKELYSDKFAEYYGIKDPDNPSRYLKLNELVDGGIIHELWFFAYQRSAGAPFECTEWKPVYDENFKRVGDEHRMAGNGGDPNEPWFGRSLRISFINSERGIGCNVESLSHSFEGTAHSNVIPYFRKYFYEFAGFDLDKRYNLPFNSFYALWGEGKGVEYPDEHTAIVKDGDKQYRLDNYVATGGNVHFTPNGRGHYDLASPATVMSTIEHYRLHDGPDGKDLAEPWTIEKFQKYGSLAPDCMGAWLVYWRQNFPGYHSKSKDDDGKPMKNWWPFLFY
jgi:hypothetical protein